MKIAVLASGGVDSSVVLARLKEQGHDVTAFYLKIWLEDELAFLGDCPWEEDLSYVRQLCEQLNVPLEVVPLQKEYHEHIVRYAIDEVAAGRTPSPDIFCNTQIKFGAFLAHIDDSYEKVASGHYAQVRARSDGRYELVQAPDSIKDQTYFLSRLSQEQLARVLFPIGHLTKAQVRDEAVRLAVPAATRKDSQGICFLGKISFADFIKQYLGTQEGPLVEYETGSVVGSHDGFWFYTIGQRKGIGLSGGPWFVVSKEPKTNTVYISRSYYTSDKKRDFCVLESVHWINEPLFGEGLVKVRHGEHILPAVVASDQSSITVQLTHSDQGLAPGQSVVMYKDSVCYGSGIISDT
jgi:tRNA (5-methylaminomethyl-2-thiouridylate)-methyltransferase